MAATEIIKRTYAPSALVGKIYATPYNSAAPLTPIGNVLEASTEQSEDVEKQDDMTLLGGGAHAEIRRVTGVKFSAKIADLNVVNRSPVSDGGRGLKPRMAQRHGLHIRVRPSAMAGVD